MEQGLAHGRQTATTLDGIRADHRFRYEWAAERLVGKTVLDAGCGIGYGSWILANMCRRVVAVDADEGAIESAKAHYAREPITHFVNRLEDLSAQKGLFDAVVCFEVLEHIDYPSHVLRIFREVAPRLLCSVPNEDVYPFEATRPLGHLRHYTPAQFTELLQSAGDCVILAHHQEGKESPVQGGFGGRTLVADVLWR